MTRVSKSPAKKRAATRPEKKFRVVFSEQQIRKHVRDLAAKLNREYKGKTLHVVGIMEDCFLFMADLIRALKMPVVCHFLKAEMRDGTSGQVPVLEIWFTPQFEVAGRDILLVDGVLQSGVTLDHLYRLLLAKQPSSLRTATLIEKTDERKVDVSTDYVCFKTRQKYLVGYGLGYQGLYRNLPCIARTN